MEITINVIREKIRKKLLYITTILGILVISVFASDMGSITIEGKDIKDYYVLIPVLINLVNFISGAMALALSVNTIPNEYERRTSHLIWSRKISQTRYHFGLTTGNVIVSWLSGFILYFTLGIFSVINGYSNILIPLALSIPLMMLYTTVVSALTSALSVKLPVAATTTIMVIVLVCGAFRGILTTIVTAMTGFQGKILALALKIIPNLAGISTQAGNLIQGKNLSLHVIIMGFLAIWIAGLGILFLKREEA